MNDHERCPHCGSATREVAGTVITYDCQTWKYVDDLSCRMSELCYCRQAFDTPADAHRAKVALQSQK